MSIIGFFILVIPLFFFCYTVNQEYRFIQNRIQDNLKENHFGTTIESFSKDEFNIITAAFNEMSVAIKQKEQMKRYVSDKLIQSVENNNILEVGDGKQGKVTIISSDIRKKNIQNVTQKI